MKTLMISSNCSGGGKTTFTLSLMKALMNRGYQVQGFKAGPDYIDTAFHTEITGNRSRNLDVFLMGEDGVKSSFSRGKGDLAVIEGVMGLYDGKGIDDEFSTYHLSEVLDHTPILLVITPKAQSLTLCAEINGIKNFKNPNIIGVVLNNISEGYYLLLKSLIEEHCGLEVFGYIPKEDALSLKSRHLGLVQSVEVTNLNEKINIGARLVEEHLNLDNLIDKFKDIEKYEDSFHLENKNLKIAVPYDEAFRFYYKENLELLEEVGEVQYFSILNDKELPKAIDFLYIGGGYPEVYKDQLSKNTSMLKSIKESLEGGLRCYGECGGLMFLTQAIEDTAMVGFYEFSCEMTKSLQNFGYGTLNFNEQKINCHEFHKSKVVKDEAIDRLFNIEKVSYDGKKKEWQCGYSKVNTVALYPHVHFFGNLEFLKHILNLNGDN